MCCTKKDNSYLFSPIISFSFRERKNIGKKENQTNKQTVHRLHFFEKKGEIISSLQFLIYCLFLFYLFSFFPLRQATCLLENVHPLLHLGLGRCLQPHGLAAGGVKGKHVLSLRRRHVHLARVAHLLQGQPFGVGVVGAVAEANHTVLEGEVALLPRLAAAAHPGNDASERQLAVDAANVAALRRAGGGLARLGDTLLERFLHLRRDAAVALDNVVERLQALPHVLDLEDVRDARALLGVDDEDGLDELRHGGGVVRRDRRDLLRQHLLHQLLHAVRSVRPPQRQQLVQDDAQRPHVGLLAVLLVLPQLRRQVERRAQERVADGLGHGLVVLVREAEVAERDHTGGADKHVRGLEVAVEHTVLVHVVEGHAQLQEHEADLVLLEVLVLRDARLEVAL
eukprot:PhM_4_TR12404/c0_g1_i1/m.98955